MLLGVTSAPARRGVGPKKNREETSRGDAGRAARGDEGGKPSLKGMGQGCRMRGERG